MQEVVKEPVMEKEKRKIILLRQEEKTWRQKSRINWMASGDRNTKLFHAYASARKQVNAIWDITNEDGPIISNTPDLHKEVVDYFQTILKAQNNIVISDQLDILRNYPRMFSQEEGSRLDEHVNLE